MIKGATLSTPPSTGLSGIQFSMCDSICNLLGSRSDAELLGLSYVSMLLDDVKSTLTQKNQRLCLKVKVIDIQCLIVCKISEMYSLKKSKAWNVNAQLVFFPKEYIVLRYICAQKDVVQNLPKQFGTS